jgi:MYXO-CTERM domain-containing protein
LRGLGDNETFQYNLVKNSYLDDNLDSNHDDGFQSWSVGPGGVGTGEVKNLTLRGNVIINAENASQPLKGTLQGIGCFDGFFVGWVVENNVVITNHWHGISLYGAKDSRIVNNTVIDNESGEPGPPWIMVTDHKDGTPSENVIVRNNLTTDLDVSGTNVVEDHNTVLGNDLSAYFVNAGAWDVHLLPNAPAIDQGSADQAPALDADSIPRPQGNGIDLGAYEWHDPSVVPVGGSAGSATGGSANGGTSSGGQTAGGSGGKSSGGASSGGTKATTGGKSSKDSDDSGGCGCRTTDSGGPIGGIAGLGTIVLLALSRRRRRGR